MAKTLTVTAMQRAQLDILISIQEGKYEDLESLHEVREKLQFAPEDRGQLIKEVPGSGVFIDQAAAAALPELSIELENEQYRRLIRLLNEWPRFRENDFSWLKPLKRNLAVLA